VKCGEDNPSFGGSWSVVACLMIYLTPEANLDRKMSTFVRSRQSEIDALSNCGNLSAIAAVWRFNAPFIRGILSSAIFSYFLQSKRALSEFLLTKLLRIH